MIKKNNNPNNLNNPNNQNQNDYFIRFSNKKNIFSRAQ